MDRGAGARWVALTGLYLVLAGQIAVSEIVASVLAGLLATAVSLGLRMSAERRFGLRAPWRWLALRTAWALLRDLGRVAQAVTAGEGGRTARQPFAGAGAEPAVAGRRALATLFA